jgi:hypothetical protein
MDDHNNPTRNTGPARGQPTGCLGLLGLLALGWLVNLMLGLPAGTVEMIR